MERRILAPLSLIASITITIIALFMPPEGIIDSSVLYVVAQLLLYSAGVLGINIKIINYPKQQIKNEKN